MTHSPHLSTAALATRLGLQPETVRSWRKRGQGPAYIKVSERRVVYPVADVEAWEKANRQEPQR